MVDTQFSTKLLLWGTSDNKIYSAKKNRLWKIWTTYDKLKARMKLRMIIKACVRRRHWSGKKKKRPRTIVAKVEGDLRAMKVRSGGSADPPRDCGRLVKASKH